MKRFAIFLIRIYGLLGNLFYPTVDSLYIIFIDFLGSRIQNQLSYFWFPLWTKTLLTSLTNIWLIWTHYNVGRRSKNVWFYTLSILTIPILEIHFQNFTFKASSFEWNRSDWISTQILLQWMRARLNWLIHNFRIPPFRTFYSNERS